MPVKTNMEDEVKGGVKFEPKPPGARYAGGGPEVSDIGQAEAWAANLKARVEFEPEPPGARYAGGEPEPEVSDIGQAEAWAANLKALFDMFVSSLSTDIGRQDALAAGLDSEVFADRSFIRRTNDPYALEGQRQREAMLDQRLRQVDQGFQATMQLLMQAQQQTLQHNNDLHSEVLSDARVARHRIWERFYEAVAQGQVLRKVEELEAELAAVKAAVEKS